MVKIKIRCLLLYSLHLSFLSLVGYNGAGKEGVPEVLKKLIIGDQFIQLYDEDTHPVKKKKLI